MHPIITQGSHPHCYATYEALLECFKQYPVMRMFNKCNPAKQELDRCLNEEYQKKRQKNKSEAQEIYDKIDQLIKQRERREQKVNEKVLTAEEKANILRKQGEKQ